MLLPCRRLDRRNNLPRNAELCKRTEGSEFIRTKIANRFVKANHTLLKDILTVSAD